MEVILLQPLAKDQPRPPAAPVHHLGPDDSFVDAVELGYLARISLQDVSNMSAVHEGMKQLRRGYVMLSVHNDAPVRKFHDLYNKWMQLDDGEAEA
jgi:hypothetical protein